jgi:hypothetical protein
MKARDICRFAVDKAFCCYESVLTCNDGRHPVDGRHVKSAMVNASRLSIATDQIIVSLGLTAEYISSYV